MEVKKQLQKALTAEQIEKNRDQLHKDYLSFTEFAVSEELQEFNQLEEYIVSPDFIKDKKKIESLSFKGSDPWRKEKSFKKLCSNKYLKAYFKLEDSNKLNNYNGFKKSELLKEFKELESQVKSSSFNKKENKSEFLRYKDLKKNSEIKDFHKFKFSKPYKYYRSVKDSDLLEEYNNVSDYLNSEEYKKEKDFLLNKKRFLTTVEYKRFERYNNLKEDDKIKNYQKYKDSDVFNALNEWELTFEDDFSSCDLDNSKWVTKYNNGNEILGESYSLEGDKHFFTDGANLELENSCLKIVTRKEKIVGKQWDGILGFREQEFDYTSGIVTTGNKFRQQYGRFEAKVRISGNPLTHCFWLMSDFTVPHIDIFKTVSNKELVNSVFSNVEQGVVNKLEGIDFSNDFFIYTLIWEKNKIEWRINDVTIWEQKDNVPHEPMFLSLGTCVYENYKGGSAPSVMEVDWVRCYKKSQ